MRVKYLSQCLEHGMCSMFKTEEERKGKEEEWKRRRERGKKRMKDGKEGRKVSKLGVLRGLGSKYTFWSHLHINPRHEDKLK